LVSRLLARVASHSAADGALPILMAATLPQAEPGAYYGPQGWQEMRGAPGRALSKPQALDVETARALWSESERLTGVHYG
jgi:hypothetical protein